MRYETKRNKILENIVPSKINLNLSLMVCWRFAVVPIKSN